MCQNKYSFQSTAQPAALRGTQGYAIISQDQNRTGLKSYPPVPVNGESALKQSGECEKHTGRMNDMKKSRGLLCLLALLLMCGCGQEETVKLRVEPATQTVDSTAQSQEAEETEQTEETGSTEETEQELSSETEKEDAAIRITISATGDVTMGNYIGQGYAFSFANVWEKEQNPAYFLENVADIFAQDDLTLVNLEGPLTTATVHKENKTYCISGLPEYVEALTVSGVEAANLSNNHTLDYFEAGRNETVETLKKNGITYVTEKEPAVYEVQGIRIGLVSGDVISYGSGIEKYFEKSIQTLQEEGVDLIIASCHWGIEREYFPNEYQKRLGHKLIDWGCDLVLGHHPHVLQGIEAYNGKYIVYSMGNFCFGANKNPSDKDCVIFQQTFVFEEGVRTEVSEAKIIPCRISSVTSRNDFKPTPAQGEDAARILDRMTEFCADLGVSFDEEGYLTAQGQ